MSQPEFTERYVWTPEALRVCKDYCRESPEHGEACRNFRELTRLRRALAEAEKAAAHEKELHLKAENAANRLLRAAEEWLIWSFEHNAWWAPNELGYTRDVNLAGRYSLVRAKEIVNNANFVALNEAMVPASSVTAWLENAKGSGK